MSGYVYILSGEQKNTHKTIFYVGSTTRELDKRVAEHARHEKGYTHVYRNLELVWSYRAIDGNKVRTIERYLKDHRHCVYALVKKEDDPLALDKFREFLTKIGEHYE